MQIVVFGGTATDMATAQTPSSSSSYRINLGAATPAWETETMPYPRVMGDAVLLPDGTVFVANGGQIGEMLYSLTHSLTHARTHARTHAHTHTRMHSRTHSLATIVCQLT